MIVRAGVGMHAAPKAVPPSSDDVFSVLRRDGYAIAPGIGSLPAYNHIASSLGRVIVRTTVELDPKRRTYVCSTDAVPFHTDHPAAKFIGWFCERQDEQDGTSLLVDMRHVMEVIGTSKAKALSDVHLPCPRLLEMTTAAHDTTPVLEFEDDEPAFYYARWLRPTRATEAGVEAWNSVFDLLESPAIRPIEIRLDPGDALFIDNRRMLHGRRRLPIGSARRLHRVWIELDRRDGPSATR